MTRARKPSSQQAVRAVLEAQSDASAAALARATGLGRSTVCKVLKRLENEGRVRRAPRERGGRGRQADRWALIPTSAGRPRLGPGELDGVVFDCLRKRIEPMTAAEVAKATERSSGAVANCLGRLEAAGRVRQVTKRPRRYVAA